MQKLTGIAFVKKVLLPGKARQLSLEIPDVSYEEIKSLREPEMESRGTTSDCISTDYVPGNEAGMSMPLLFHYLKGLDNLRGTEGEQLLRAIYELGWSVSNELQSGLSPTRDAVGAAVDLLFAGAVFKGTREGRGWVDQGVSLLEQELFRQILGDGGSAEQSLGYHRYVLDSYWLATDFLERNGLADCGAWKTRLIDGERFLSTFADTSGNVPSIGERYDRPVLAPGTYPKRATEEYKENRPLVIFPTSGYTVIRSGNGIVLTLDHGPTGMAPHCRMGHADALSITLSVAGEQILVDPGTYGSDEAPEWQRYFRGTRAHNTVMIDGHDQAVTEVDLLTCNPFTSRLVHASVKDGNPYVEAIHDGYGRLREPVTHRRVVDFCSDSLFLIKDTFSGTGLHKFELNLHLHPQATLIFKDTHSVIRRGEAEIAITLLGGRKFRTACGEKTPPFGWYSLGPGMKDQAPVLSCAVTGSPEEVTFITAVSLGWKRPEIEVD
jgi:hypothetical protein